MSLNGISELRKGTFKGIAQSMKSFQRILHIKRLDKEHRKGHSSGGQNQLRAGANRRPALLTVLDSDWSVSGLCR